MWQENKNKLDTWCKSDVYSFVKIGFFKLNRISSYMFIYQRNAIVDQGGILGVCCTVLNPIISLDSNMACMLRILAPRDVIQLFRVSMSPHGPSVKVKLA